MEKSCVILLNMGGPGSTTDVREYLYNIFSDRTLIRLPGGAVFQKPFAGLISLIRSGRVRSHYEQIGGGSPLLHWTRLQAEQIEDILVKEITDFKCYIGMRYFYPTIPDAIERAYTDGYRRVLFLPLHPQYSLATTGSSFEAARKELRRFPDLKVSFVRDFHDDEGYVSLLKEYVSKNIGEDETLLFSAHSLPQRFVDEGDPYVEQIKWTAKLAADGREYHVSFQSRTGPVTWVGPDTIDEARRLLKTNQGGLFIVPISFVSDHIETLYEIDIELKKLLQNDGGDRIRRMPMFNEDPRFASVLAAIIRRRLKEAHVAV